MSKEKKSPPPPAQGEARVVVIMDRAPFWNGTPQPQNAVITGPRDDEAVKAMLERGWIKEVAHG